VIGHKLSNKIKLEEIETKNMDILAMEGTIENQNIGSSFLILIVAKINQERSTKKIETFRRT